MIRKIEDSFSFGYEYIADSSEDIKALVAYLGLVNVDIWDAWNYKDSRILSNWQIEEQGPTYFGTEENKEYIIEEFIKNYYTNDNQLRCEGTGGSDSGIPESVSSPKKGTPRRKRPS